MRITRQASLLIVFAALLPCVSNAQPAWYRGVVTRVAILSGNDFIVTFDNEELADCQWRYVYFRGSALGAEKVRNAYALAMMALAGGRTLGVVIDKAINGPGGVCNQEGAGMFDAQ